MYEITKAVIESKNYELSDMLRKIEVLWVQGSISDAEREELLDLARDNADVKQSVDIFAWLEDHERRLKVVEEAQKDSEKTEDYPDYVVGHKYYNGDKVTFDGKHYECIAPEGVVCVWSPIDYPTYWKEITE